MVPAQTAGASPLKRRTTPDGAGPAGPIGPVGPGGPAGQNGAAGPAGAKGDKGDSPAVQATCRLTADRRGVTCTVSSPGATTRTVKANVRIYGRTASKTVTKKGKITITTPKGKVLKSSARVQLTVTIGGVRRQLVVPVVKK